MSNFNAEPIPADFILCGVCNNPQPREEVEDMGTHNQCFECSDHLDRVALGWE